MKPHGENYYDYIGGVSYPLNEVRDAVKGVLAAHKEMQLNLESEAARDLLVDKICSALTQKKKGKEWKY